MKHVIRQPLSRAGFFWSAAAVVAALLPVLSTFPAWFAGLLLAAAALGIGLGWRRIKLPPWLRLAFTLLLAGAAAASVGFVPGPAAGAALLAAMLALKLLEADTLRDGRSACSFALFAIIAGFLQDQGPVTLLLALAAAVVVIAALGHLAQHEFPEQRPAPASVAARLSRSAWLLAVSLPLAFTAFFLFPRFPNPLWGAASGPDSSRSGLSDDMEPGDIAELLLDDSPALRVSFEGTAPPKQAMYWRGPVMSHFDGRRWSRWDGDAFMQAAEIAQTDGLVRYEVMQEPASHRYLMALDIATEAPTESRTGYGRTVYVRPSNNMHRSRFTSATRYVLEPELSNDMRRRARALPAGSNPRTAQLIGQWKAENPEPDALIQRVLKMFNEQFRYTLSPPPLGRDSVDDFLFNTKAGYCEHFASAFAVMMRMGDVPARVVTGYQGGELNTLGNYWLVRQSDAHAWTEVWLEGRGWVRVDPTAAIAPARIEQGQAGIGREPSAFARFSLPLLQALDVLRRGWNDFVLDFDVERQRALLQRLGLDWNDWRHVGAALGISLGLALALTFALLLRAASIQQTPLQAAWNRFLAKLARRGAQKRPDETATAFARRLDETLAPTDTSAAAALIDRYVAHAYAPQGDGQASERELIRMLRRFRFARTTVSTRTSPP